MRRADVIGGLTLTVALLYFLWLNSHHPPDAARLPYILIIGGIILSALLVAGGLRRRGEGEGDAGVAGRPWVPRKAFWRVTALVAGMLAFGVLIESLGFYLTAIVFLVAVMWAMGEKRPLALGAISVGTVVFIYLLFHAWLRVPLPVGVFGS